LKYEVSEEKDISDQVLTDKIVKELSGLPESRQAEVLAFVRFLKIGLADTKETAQRFDSAVEQARRIAENQQISPDDIDAEIRAYRTNIQRSNHL
jgi:hypothetical protein